ncbi:MAG: transposon-encoded TnpW family protein [Oscillibacter sp.]|nr:transposon-encoded TnpW family protein [Oscillibacter sp.]
MQSNNTYLTRRIGSTTYKIKVHFDDTSRETMEDKIFRLIREESLDKPENCGIIRMPQMSRQPERSLA